MGRPQTPIDAHHSGRRPSQEAISTAEAMRGEGLHAPSGLTQPALRNRAAAPEATAAAHLKAKALCCCRNLQLALHIEALRACVSGLPRNLPALLACASKHARCLQRIIIDYHHQLIHLYMHTGTPAEQLAIDRALPTITRRAR